MNYNQKHTQALTRFRKGQPAEAARLFAEALAEKETSEGWNDWATAQAAAGATLEAEAGYERALELNPNNNEALVNLAVVRTADSRFAEALALLHRVPPAALQSAAVQKLLAHCRQHAVPEEDAARREEYLRQVADHRAAQSDCGAHLDSYAAALRFLPHATTGQRLLELRTRFAPFPASLKNLKGYEVVYAQLGSGPAPIEEPRVEVGTPEESNSPLHTFDFELAPWPFADASFDVVLACDVLEYLARDPMLVLQELNRILKSDGFFLLMAANVASARSIAKVLRGDSPYLFGQYRTGGDSRDRHHREYTPGELERILACAGFGNLHLQTHNRRGLPPEPDVLRSLLTLHMPIGRRGDDILVLARKRGGVQERYPAEFYQLSEAPRATTCVASGKPDSQYTPIPRAAERNTARHSQGKNHAASRAISATTSEREKILIVAEGLADPLRTGNDVCLMETVRTLRNLGHPIRYAALDNPEGRDWEQVFSALGAEVSAGKISDEQFASLLRNGRFDIAILTQDFSSDISIPERYLDEIRRASPPARIVLLTQDCFSRRERRRAELSGLLSDEERAAGLEQREREGYQAADLVLTVSEDARRNLQALGPALRVECFPIPAVPVQNAPGWNDRRDLLFLGDLSDPVDADFQWLRTEIWPRIRRALPGVKLHVADVDLPESAAATRMEGIVALGHVAEAGAVLSRYRMLLAPLRLGARNRTLVLALAAAIPIVTTSPGAEGLEVEDGKHLLVADSAAKFSAAVARVYNNAELWQQLADHGRAHVEQTFSPQRAQQRIAQALQTLRGIQPAKAAEVRRWSAREVEQFEPRILNDNSLTPAQRITLRMHAYAEYAQHLLAEHRPAEACEQLRHIFALARSPLPRHHFFANVLALLERGYRELGNPERGVRCGREAISFLPEFNVKLSAGAGPARGKAGVSGLCNPLPLPAMPSLEL
jgi:tetratricopeptide (TPR) repeat protein